MVVDVLAGCQDAAAFLLPVGGGVGTAGQDARVGAEGELVEQVHEIHELHEALLLARDGVEGGVDLDDGGKREGEAVLGTAEHLLDGCELVAHQEVLGKQARRELDRDLADVGGVALALLPDVLQVLSADQDEVVGVDGLDVVPDDALGAGGVLYEIEFEIPVAVQRIVEFSLVPFDDEQAVLLGDRGYFV